MIECTSCGKEVTNNYVEFKCPGCGEIDIRRCDNCRKRCTNYRCPECGFRGP